MAQQEVDSKVGDLASSNSEAALCGENKQLPVPVKKTPLRDLQSETNIVAQKGSSNPIVLKEAVVSEAVKVSGIKRPSPDSQMSPPQQSSSNSGANSHLVYVRRKSEAEIGKTSNSEATADNVNSQVLSVVGAFNQVKEHNEATADNANSSQIGHKEDELHPKSLISEPQVQNLPESTSNPVCDRSIPSEKPSVPLSLGNSNTKTSTVELETEAAPSANTSPVEEKVKEHNWEDRYVQLQMYLKKLDQSSLEDHLQSLRSLSATELSRHAVELEKRAIQLSLEQGKELQRVKALNVLGKSIKPTSDPPAQQQTPQC